MVDLSGGGRGVPPPVSKNLLDVKWCVESSTPANSSTGGRDVNLVAIGGIVYNSTSLAPDSANFLSKAIHTKAGSISLVLLLVALLVAMMWGCYRCRRGKPCCCCSGPACLAFLTCGRTSCSVPTARYKQPWAEPMGMGSSHAHGGSSHAGPGLDLNAQHQLLSLASLLAARNGQSSSSSIMGKSPHNWAHGAPPWPLIPPPGPMTMPMQVMPMQAGAGDTTASPLLAALAAALQYQQQQQVGQQQQGRPSHALQQLQQQQQWSRQQRPSSATGLAHPASPSSQPGRHQPGPSGRAGRPDRQQQYSQHVKGGSRRPTAAAAAGLEPSHWGLQFTNPLAQDLPH